MASRRGERGLVGLTFPQSTSHEPERQGCFMTNVMGMAGRFPIEDVSPSVACGRYPAKAVVGELVPVSAAALRDEDAPLFERVSPGLALADLLWEYPVRELVTATEPYPLYVDRERALFSAWYEFFPRSEGTDPYAQTPVHGTFDTAA